MSLLSRTQDLHLYGPAPLEQIIQIQLEVANTKLSYSLFFHPILSPGVILDENKFSVSIFPLKHRIECWGFLFRQKRKPRSINPVEIKKFDIPASFYPKLQNGEDYRSQDGTLVKNGWVTVPNIPCKSFAYCADTIYDESLAEIVKGVDLLYHETTYLNGSSDKAAARYHSTTGQAANIALKAGVKRLIIGHFSSRYEHLEDFLTETAEVFKNTELSKEGTCFFI